MRSFMGRGGSHLREKRSVGHRVRYSGAVDSPDNPSVDSRGLQLDKLSCTVIYRKQTNKKTQTTLANPRGDNKFYKGSQ